MTVQWFLIRENNRWLGWNTNITQNTPPFRWKIKWRLEHLGALGIMGGPAPLTVLCTDLLSALPCGIDRRISGQTDSMGPLAQIEIIMLSIWNISSCFSFSLFSRRSTFHPQRRTLRATRKRASPSAHSEHEFQSNTASSSDLCEIGFEWSAWNLENVVTLCGEIIFYTLSLSVSFTSISYTLSLLFSILPKFSLTISV